MTGQEQAHLAVTWTVKEADLDRWERCQDGQPLLFSFLDTLLSTTTLLFNPAVTCLVVEAHLMNSFFLWIHRDLKTAEIR